MAIDKFGESLLSDVRKRKDDQYQEFQRQQRKAQKRADKDARKQALIGFGLNVLTDVGNSFVRNQTENFLRNENTLKNSLTIKNATSMAQRATERQQKFEASGLSELDYFTQQAIPTVQGMVARSDYSDGTYSAGDLQQATAILATKLGKDLAEQHKKQYAAAQRLALKEVSFNDFIKEIRESQPQTVGSFLTKQIKNVFTKGGEDPVTASARLSGMLDDAKDEAAYFDIYKQTQNGFTSLDIMNSLKEAGFKIDKAKVRMGDSLVVKSTDPDTGEAREETVFRTTVNGVDTGILIKANGEQFEGLSTRKDITQTVARLKPETIGAVQAQVNKAPEENRQYIQAAMTYLVGDTDDKERIESAKKDIYGRIFLTSKKLKNQYGFPSEVADQVAATMHELRYEGLYKDSIGILGGVESPDTSQDIMPDGKFHPIAAAMAFEVSKNQGFRSALPSSQVDIIQANLINDIENASRLTVPQLTYTLGSVDGETKGFIDDPRFRGMAARENILNLGTEQFLSNRSSLPETRDSVEEKPTEIAVRTDEEIKAFIADRPELQNLAGDMDIEDQRIAVLKYEENKQPRLLQRFIDKLKTSYDYNSQLREARRHAFSRMTKKDNILYAQLDPHEQRAYLQRKFPDLAEFF